MRKIFGSAESNAAPACFYLPQRTYFPIIIISVFVWEHSQRYSRHSNDQVEEIDLGAAKRKGN